MSDPKTTGLPCSHPVADDAHSFGFLCGVKEGTVKDPRQDRYDVGLCPRHLAWVLERTRLESEVRTGD